MQAYAEALRETSRPWAPWYAIPADDKHFMRATVARLVADALDGLGLHYPKVDEADRARFRQLREQLEREARPRGR
jgi:hypothetical protein